MEEEITIKCSRNTIKICQDEMSYAQTELESVIALADTLAAMTARRTGPLHGLALLLCEHLGYLKNNADCAAGLLDKFATVPTPKPTETLHAV
ncbi:hypothetical protein [Nitrospira sp. Nam80]